MLTIKEAASYLRVATSTLRRYVREKQIRAYRPNNGKLYFLEEDLRSWVLNNGAEKKEGA